MKAPNFSYVKPESLAEAVEILVRHDGAAVPIAGGQSLLAGLSMRLSRPELLVDLTGLDSLRGIRVEKDHVHIGALTRHVDVLRSEEMKRELPLIGKAIHFVAHVAVRNRGTIGGSVAYADPSAELPACIVALNATVSIAGPDGVRDVAADQFFHGLFETDLKIGEIIVGFRIPRIRTGQRWAFLELSRRRGDFAMAGVAVLTDTDDTTITAARVTYFGCSEYPRLAENVGAALIGKTLPLGDTAWIAEAVSQDVEPSPSADMRADTKLKLATVVTERALAELSLQEK
ncbi:MAG TPA: xanthine dehydrogenase family protein subunit M [Xanthobacteraceae bacterium]|nr:xanthine dehydrogenase family protein subunit M [Xanthobacteraceae bacterium]